ncbi:MAG: KEOPS complex subunit Pcc1 [Nitrososphaerota archaeon]|nr:KEOPS complex subunit Pcc1 [Candidatus Calditenuaceae archaeon]MDW8073051.1 KEOPS complex subunit Pcc1 [Nitrososphaerota archaeon]
MSHKVNLKVSLHTPYSETILKAIQPEISSLPSRRIRASARFEGDELILEFFAEDLVALRAGLNTFLRWVIAADNCLRTIAPDSEAA